MDKYMDTLQEAVNSQDLHKVISVYVKARKDRIDLVDEVVKLLFKIGKDAVERVARMLNDKSNSVEFRGTASHLLMTAINLQPEIGNTDSIKNELQHALTDADFFVSANATESLIALGIKEISGVPIREYARNHRLQQLNDEMSRLLGR